MMKNQIKKGAIVSALPLLALGAMMIPGAACGGDDNPLCCSENNFQVGGTITAEIGGSAKSQVAAQAVADFAGVASAMVEDLSAACRNIATDLGVSREESDGALAGKEDKADIAQAWCGLAVGAIAKIKTEIGARVEVEVKKPECTVSASASLDCQAGCKVDANCNVSAELPTCEGGKLEVSCSGECKGEANASISCEGSCVGECTGGCQASGGVECNGKCEGTCEASGSASGNGLEADGKCTGVCKGTCEVTKPGVDCSGSCKGSCKGTCKASAGASVKCDGSCQGTAEPIKCSGGKPPTASCEVDADCGASCNASASAKASCTPPAVSVTVEAGGSITGDAQLKLAKLKATLQANLSVVGVVKGRAGAMVGFAGTLQANAQGLVDIKPACIPTLAFAMVGAVKNVNASVSMAASLIPDD